MEFERNVFKRNVVSESFFAATEALETLPKPLYTRVNESAAGAEDLKRFRDVITAMIADGSYGQLVAIHVDMRHRQHTMGGPIGSQRFLPWHRCYLLKLEQQMRAREPKAFIPYWDWTQNRAIPGWMADFMPTGLPLPDGTTLDVERNPGADPEVPTLPEKAAIDQIMEAETYLEFTLALEGARPFGAHNQVHVWVGGIMNTMASPADPIFFLHHAQVDRLWSIWQQTHQQAKPRLKARDAVLDPWEENAPDMENTAELGYTYAAAGAASGSGL